MPIDANDIPLPADTDLAEAAANEGNLVPAALGEPLNMTKDEKLRVTSLMMAINYHRETIVHDPGMYQQLKMDNKMLSATTAHKVVAQAVIFEMYLRGGYDELVAEAVEEDGQTTIDEGNLAKTIKHTMDDVFGKLPDDEDDGRPTEQL